MRISQVFEAWGITYALMSCKAQEDAAYAGCNTWLTATQQIGQASLCYEICSQLTKAQEKTSSVFLEIAGNLILFPLALGVLKTVTNEKNIEWLHANFGNLCQMASVVMTLALLYFGHTAYATTALTLMTIGYLNRHHYFPLQIEKAFYKISGWVGTASVLISSPWMIKLLVLTELLDIAHRYFFKKYLVLYEKAEHRSHLENRQQFKDIYEEKVAVEVNPDHIWITPFPYSSRTEFGPLRELCDSFQWPMDRLLRDLDNDPRWQRSEEKKDDPSSAIAYAKASFNTLIHGVQNQCIKTGEILNYGVLKSYLGYITDHIHQAPQQIQEEIMLQLAIEGGDYCGAGVYSQLEMAATTLLLNQVSTNKEERARLPLKQRLLLLLQQERLRVMEGFHDTVNKINFAFHLFKGGKKDVHAMNYSIELLGEDFGLPDQGASQDKTVQITKIEQWVSRWMLGVYPENLWTGLSYFDRKKRQYEHVQGYTVNRIIDAIQQQMGLPIFGNPDVYAWAREWAQKKDPTLEDRIEQAEFESFGAKIHDNFLKAMLVDMGILRIKKSPQTAPGLVRSMTLSRPLS